MYRGELALETAPLAEVSVLFFCLFFVHDRAVSCVSVINEFVVACFFSFLFFIFFFWTG